MKILVTLPKISFISTILHELSKSFDFVYNKNKDIITIIDGDTKIEIVFVSESKAYSKTKGIIFDYTITYGRKSTPEWLVDQIKKSIKEDK